MTSNWNKFMLLMWKNWKIQWNFKTMLFFELLLPILFCLIIVSIRTLSVPTYYSMPTLFPKYKINFQLLSSYMDPNSDSPIKVWQLAYSPKNNVLEDLMGRVSKRLSLNIPSIGLENAKKLEEHMIKISEQCIAGIQFDDNLSSATKLPDSILYTIRFPSELRTYHFEQFWYTDRIYPELEFLMPRTLYEDGGDPGYLREGFAAIQHIIALEYIIQLAKENGKKFKRPKFALNRTPYAPYYFDELVKVLEIFVPLIIVLSFLHAATSIVKRITTEKEKQLKEVMEIMGIQSWLHWVAWFVMSFLMLALSMTIVILLLKLKLSNNPIFEHSNFLVILLIFYIYCIAIITFCFLISAIFSKASTATAITCLVWFIFYLPYQSTYQNYKNLSYTGKIFTLFFFNSAFAYALTLLLRYENKGEGLHWHNLYKPVNVDDNLSIGVILLIMLTSAIIHMLLALYFERIFTGNFGVPEKWYYPFTSEFWLKCKKNKRNDIEYIKDSWENNDIGVSIRLLTKQFNDYVAVDNLKLDLKKNEITVLLGHNGAGKTTTMSMLTGMIPPTSGTAIINGYDITKNLQGARTQIGLCPQYNILFDELTVREHIIFYSKLKGLNKKEIENEINKYLSVLQMKNKMNTKSKNLSGGMQRKLSVVAALFGGTKVVFLDEPSSGMDPAARRTLWDLIQLEKQNRTILLSTHFMDEADVLGDKVAIMSSGQLKAYGTSFSLKKQYGSGYKLICVKEPDCDSTQVTALLRKYIPDIKINSEVGSELTYHLPDSDVELFPKMFQDLENNSNVLKLNGYGVSIPTLDEVFMIVGAEKLRIPVGLNEQLIAICANNDEPTSEKRRGFIYSQWKAMLLKKNLYSKRNYYIVLSQLLLILFFITAIGITLRKIGSDDEWPPLLMTLKDFQEVRAILSVDDKLNDQQKLIIESYKDYVKSFGKDYTTIITKEKFDDYYAKLDPVLYTKYYLIGAQIESDSILVYFNNELYHNLPLSLNVMHNAILKAIFNDNKHTIKVYNHPLPKLPKTKINEAKSSVKTNGFQLAVNLSFCMAFLTAFYALFMVKERESRSKLLQFVSGVRIYVFWISHFIYDFIVFILLASIAILYITVYQIQGYETIEELSILYCILIFYGLVIIPFIYLLSGCFKEAVSAFSYISIMNILSGAIFILVYVLRLPEMDLKSNADTMRYIFGILPNFALSDSINNLYVSQATKSACLDSCRLLPELPDCNIKELCKINETCCVSGFFSTKEPGNGLNLIYLSVTLFISILVIIMTNCHLNDICISTSDKKSQQLTKNDSRIFDEKNLDEDVQEELRRIDNMSPEERKLNNLVVHRVKKNYKKFLAVNQVSFGVKNSEVFGLLGVNGAGKTTLFKMLTGDEKITAGDAYVKGNSLTHDMQKVYRDIGYCPQFDALLEDLTGREIIRIFCLLRGIPDKKINKIANVFAYGFGYTKHIDKACRTYSGGNKRKLSATIAMLGCPSVIYLDEPTSGMDPGARRQLWNMVNQMRELGKVIVLTSHSMEECEALCTRLAIMVNGEFKCIGSTQHLKNKFSKGLVIKLKILRTNDDISDKIIRITDFMQLSYPDSVLREQYQDILTFIIPLSSVEWSEIFDTIQRNKDELEIEDYTISQTTLEEIFLGLASYQREGSITNKNVFLK